MPAESLTIRYLCWYSSASRSAGQTRIVDDDAIPRGLSTIDSRKQAELYETRLFAKYGRFREATPYLRAMGFFFSSIRFASAPYCPRR